MVYSLVSSADYNQAGDCLPIAARGRQCVPNCLMFLLSANYVKPCSDIETCDLNEILLAGSNLYCALSTCGLISDLVDPVKLPERIFYKGKTIFVSHKGVLSGFFNNNVITDGEVYYNFEDALLKATVTGKNFIIVFSGVSVGVFRNKSVYYIFDSHSRDKNGMSCPDGKCVLGAVKSLSELTSFFCALSRSVSHNSQAQFDLHTFSLSMRYKYTTFVIQIFSDTRGYNIETVRRRKRQNVSSNNLPQKMQKLLEGRSLKIHLDDRSSVTSERAIPDHTGNESIIVVESISPSCRDISSNEVNHLQDETLILSFENLVSTGPDYVCSCCTQTFFKHYMSNVRNLSESSKSSVSAYLTKQISVDNCEWICKHCLDSARSGKVPKFWVNNGLKFPQKPKELDLSNLEERLVSPRLPFMQLREMPRGGQVNLKGNIVNVPADVNGTMKSLPRMIDENETIMLKLKRKISYKHHVAFENVRPNKVFAAAKWLVGNSTLFRNEGITVNETWLQQTQAMPSNSEEPADIAVEQSGTDDNWTEENFMDRPTGNLDTFLQSLDFREFNQVLSVAPGENNTPLGLFQDLQSEVLSFPTIFCGQTRSENSERAAPLHYSDICKWELRNVDRRVALCVPNIFFKLKRLQIKQIRDKVSLAIRKCKTGGATFTAGDILTPGFVDKLTLQNDGYRVLRTLRGSPPYWEASKRDVFAMIKQLGIPTWFCSFSAAETKWEPLLKSLAKLVQGKNLSSEEIQNLSWQDKCLLIKSDPVTCARFFDHRVQKFIKHILKHQSQPVGDIVDFFYRVEFQQRGSPHIHMVIWVDGAPVHGVSSDAAVAAFVSKYITCHKDDTITSLINYQTHRHAQTCRKRGKDICRFNFPIPPMPETVVLHPLTDSEEPVEPEAYEKMIACLNDMHHSQQEWLFEDFLQQLQIDYASYIKIIRSSIKRPTVFLKRTVSECRINSYNHVLLRCWKANMDIQYILDPYSCVSYIVSYIAKGQRGLSNLLREACNEARELDSDVRQQVRRIGNQFLSSVEIGAQEAVYLTLQLPLRRCTREVVYVDTKRPDDRTSLIKPISQLKDMPATSRNIEMDNVLKRYKRRPAILQEICYADFASWYDLCKGKKVEMSGQTCDDELPEIDYQDDKDDDLLELDENSSSSSNVIRYACGTRIRRRRRQKVIYSCITPINHDREEHFREKIMLYTHWRDEDKDLICGHESFEQSYSAKEEEINANKSNYEKNEDALHESILENLHEDDFSSVHPQAQHENLLDEEEGTARSATHGCFDPGVGCDHEDSYDLGIDLGVSRRPVCLGDLPNREMDDEQYLQSVRELNIDQKKIFYHILNKVKTQSLPFYTFLSGGAGCGKSVVIRALNQALLKYFNHLRTEDPNTSKLLLCAPTGKAAHNVGGCTIHSAFCIPASQGFYFKPLDMQQLNTMRARYRDLKVIIIDEISMVGRGMLNFVNLRLQEIKGCRKSFGDVSVLAVGDLYQLKPVHDSWVFSQVYNSVQLQCMGTNLWIDLFDFFELKEIMRQKDDHAFALLLNRLREGEYTEEDLSLLEQRKIETLGLTDDSIRHMPHLFCTRADVATHNKAILSHIPSSDRIEIEAIDSISGNTNASLQAQILSRVPLDPTKIMGLQKLLLLGLGMPAELCLNIDTTDGLTNGASCCIKKFDFRVENSCRCSIVWVEFDDKTIGRCWRTKYKHLYQEGIAMSWTPVLETCRMFTYKYYKTYQIVRRQFPLYISAGKTIHKAQGSTIKGAVLHFGSKKISHIHYVGLSRVTRLSEVHISKLNPEKISVSPEVQEEMERLRAQRQITDFPNTRPTPHGIYKVCFQNCRSLRKHIEDVKHEETILSADIFALSETRLSGVLPANFEIDGFKMLSSELHQSTHGITVYYRNGLEEPLLFFKTVSYIEYALLIVQENIVISFVYCPPKVANVVNITAFLSALMNEVSEVISNQDAKLLLLGDFNFEYSECARLVQLFRDRLGVRQLIRGATTDYGSCLDHIYTNFPPSNINRFGTSESYYSDHKALYIEFSVNPHVCPLANFES